MYSPARSFISSLKAGASPPALAVGVDASPAHQTCHNSPLAKNTSQSSSSENISSISTLRTSHPSRPSRLYYLSCATLPHARAMPSEMERGRRVSTYRCMRSGDRHVHWVSLHGTASSISATTACHSWSLEP